MFAPASSRGHATTGGLMEFTWQPTDDGRYAIVEFVAKDASVLRAVLTDARTIKTFEKGKHRRADIEKELQKYKRDFRLDRMDRRPR